MPYAADGAEQIGTTPAFDELRNSLEYAYNMVESGRHLEKLQVAAFDIKDLYRSAWVQAVAALDRWVGREIHDRAFGFAQNPQAPRPQGFLRLKVPVGLIDVLQGSEELHEEFEEFLQAEFGFETYQQPDRIKRGLRNVSDVDLWSQVPKTLLDKDVRDNLKHIVWRRNQIVHASDVDPLTFRKREITADDAYATVEWIKRLATAISSAIGPPPLRVVSMNDAEVPQETDQQPSIGAARLGLYQQFWSRFDVVVKQRSWSQSAPPKQNWWSLPSGIGDVAWGVSFATYGCRSELYFGSSDAATNLARLAALEAKRDKIVAAFADPLVFDELPGKKACRIETRLLGPTIDARDEWTDIIRWMADTQQRLRSAIESVGGIPTVVAS